MKKLQKFAVIVLVVMMVAALAAPALAAGRNYTAISGGIVKVEKYLVMETTARTPAVTFTFTAAPGTAKAATETKLAVRAGNDSAVTGTPVVGTAVFTANQQTFTSVQTLPADTGTKTATQTNDPVTLTTGQQYARSAFTVDFSNVKFAEPGVYRWVLTEAANAAAAGMGITNDADATRVLDVYVIDNNGTLQVEGYVLHNDDAFQPNVSGTAAEPSGGKAKGYINNFETEDLTISKTVAGNQGSKDQYFKFTVTLGDLGSGTVIPVNLSNADATTLTNAASPTAHTNPTTLTANASGTVTQEFWMQHGQSIVLTGLPKNASYTVVEDNVDYAVSTSVKEGTGAAVAGTTATVTDADITADTTVAYTNTKAGVIPTGVMLAVAPFVGVVALGGVGIAAVAAKNRKKRDEK